MGGELTAYETTAHEARPEARRFVPLREAITNYDAVKAESVRPRPLDGTVTDQRGRVYRYWSDGSLRRDR